MVRERAIGGTTVACLRLVSRGVRHVISVEFQTATIAHFSFIPFPFSLTVKQVSCPPCMPLSILTSASTAAPLPSPLVSSAAPTSWGTTPAQSSQRRRSTKTRNASPARSVLALALLMRQTEVFALTYFPLPLIYLSSVASAAASNRISKTVPSPSSPSFRH